MTGPRTQLTHVARPAGDKVTVNPPTERGSTVILTDPATLYTPGARTYGRLGLSTHRALEDALCQINGARSAILTPSGLSACTFALTAFVRPGAHVLIVDCVYSPTRKFCDGVLAPMGVAVTYFDPRIGDDIGALIRPETTAIFLESPGSLTFEVQDTPAIVARAQAAGVVTIMDDTWSAGRLCQPLALGVDVTAQALTKYAAGHSDVLMGAIMTRADEHADAVMHMVRSYGVAPGPDDAALVLRGLRTLDVRLERSGTVGLSLAAWLARQPQVDAVLHPGLAGSMDHEMWRRDFSGSAGLFAFTLKSGGRDAAERFLHALDVFAMGFSWGGYESLAIVCDPQLTRVAVPWSANGPLIRLGVGLEDEEDLRADLERGLAALASA